MQVTVKFKILPNKEQERYLKETLNEYITTVNNIVQSMINNKNIKLTSKDIEAKLPSAVKNQAIQDANFEQEDGNNTQKGGQDNYGLER